MGDKVRTVEIPQFSSSDLARLELMRLASDPELIQDRMIGGPTPPEMEEENRRKGALARKKRFDIIEKHGVFDEYLAPMLREEAELVSKLAALQRDIEELRRRRDKVNELPWPERE